MLYLYCYCYRHLYNQFLFSFLHFILCRMCVCHMFNEVFTYLLTFIVFVYRHIRVPYTLRRGIRMTDKIQP